MWVQFPSLSLKKTYGVLMNNRISVIIPAFNAEKTIQRTLASLISNRDYIYEIQLIDDHSYDDTVGKAQVFYDLLPQLSIWTSDGYHNPGLARKTGLQLSSGDFVTFIDADDCITPSSFYYVSKQLDKNIILLHTKTMYFESGEFRPLIEYADNSCGGNFYRLDYLINNKLYPHENLPLSEDEYFNDIVKKQLLLDNLQDKIEHFDYPVYEVHHDIEWGKSHAIENWIEYCIRYHLLYKEYVAERFKDTEIKAKIQNEYCDNFIFCYFLYQALLLDEDLDNREVVHQMIYFQRAVRYFEQTFGNRCYIYDYYNRYSDFVSTLLDTAVSCTGINFNEYLFFDKFLECL